MTRRSMTPSAMFLLALALLVSACRGTAVAVPPVQIQNGDTKALIDAIANANGAGGTIKYDDGGTLNNTVAGDNVFDDDPNAIAVP